MSNFIKRHTMVVAQGSILAVLIALGSVNTGFVRGVLQQVDALTLPQVAWLSLIAYAIHYAEEGPRLVAWFEQHHPMRGLNYTQGKLRAENVVLFSITALASLLVNLFPASFWAQAAVISAAIGFLGNTFFHLIPTLRTGVYSPGLVSACSVFPLYFMLVIWKASELGALTPSMILVAFVMGNLALPAVVVATHKTIERAS